MSFAVSAAEVAVPKANLEIRGDVAYAKVPAVTKATDTDDGSQKLPVIKLRLVDTRTGKDVADATRLGGTVRVDAVDIRRPLLQGWQQARIAVGDIRGVHVDRLHPCIKIGPSNRVFAHVPIAAVQLQAPIDQMHLLFSGVPLGHGGLLGG